MKVVFPHMGNVYIPLEALVKKLGAEVLLAPPLNRESIKVGVKHAPEFICLPFKATLGSLIPALEKGADTVVMSTAIAPCRFCYYGYLYDIILKDIGYKFDSIIFGRRSFFNLLKKIVKINKFKAAGVIIEAAKIFYHKAKALDKIETLSRKKRPYEVNKGETEEVLKKCLRELRLAENLQDIQEVAAKSEKLFEEIKTKDNVEKKIKILIVGEVYVVIEPELNFHLEKLLAELSVEVDLALGSYYWLFRPFRIKDIMAKEEEAERLAKPYLKHKLGGEEMLSIGLSVKAIKNKDYDGIIHLYPFSCQPEVQARTILDRISKEYNLPILHISVDENTSEVGFKTRIEAFIDLLSGAKPVK